MCTCENEQPFAEYFGCLEQAVVQSQILPAKLAPSGNPREVNLPVGDDLAAADEKGDLKSATLRVQFVARVPDDKVELHVNGHAVVPESEDSEKGWVTYRPKPKQFRPGDNALLFRATASRPGNKESIVIRSIELDVDYR